LSSGRCSNDTLGAFGHFYAYAPSRNEYAIDYQHVQRWSETSAQRPAVKRGRMVNTWGQPASQFHERHEASDFDMKTQEEVAAAR